MIRDLEFAVKWLEHGRNPDSYQKGAERARVYLEDPDILNSIEDKSAGRQAEQIEVNPEEQQLIKQMLANLTEREEDVYMMHHAKMLPLEEIGQLVGVTKSTVSTTYRRAEKKINQLLEA